MMTDEKPRVSFGCHDFLNSKPLLAPLLKGEIPYPFRLVLGTPARIAEQLRAGEIQLGVIPAIEYARGEGYLLVPEVAIASRGAVKTVAIFSRKPLSEIRSIAVDQRSRTSVAMLQILFRERYGREPALLPRRPALEEMLTQADGALIIGDLTEGGADIEVYDLGEAWYRLTGRPFVHAFLALDSRWELKEEVEILKESQRRGLAQLPAIAEEEARVRGLSYEVCLDYLQHRIRYQLGPEEIEGLRHFYRLAWKHRLVAQEAPLHFFEKGRICL